MKKILRTLCLTAICLAVSGTMLTSCNKLEEEGMNNGADFYSYRAQSNDFDYQDGAGPFDTAIRFSVGMEPIQGGNDDMVIKACDACYEDLKPRLSGRSGKVIIFKIRHPDGKQKTLREYEF